MYQIVEYDWVQNQYSGYMESIFLQYTNLLFTDEERAIRKAKDMNYPYIFEKYRVIEAEVMK